MTNWLVDRLSRFIVRHPFCLTLFVTAITIGALVGYFAPEWPGRIAEHVWSAARRVAGVKPSDSQRTDDQSAQRGSRVLPGGLPQGDVVLVIQSEKGFFDTDSVKALRAVARELQQLDQVQLVGWLDDVPIMNLFGLPQPILPKSEHVTDQRWEAAREAAKNHPLVYGQMISDDLHALLMMIYLDPYMVFDDAAVMSEIKAAAQRAASRYPEVDFRFQVTGPVPMTIAAIDLHERNQAWYQTIGYGMVLLMALILFRGLRAVVIVALAPAAGVFWSMGYINFLGYDQNPLIDVIVPILVSLVGLTDGVHLMVQIRRFRATGLAPAQATEEALRIVGLACFLTSLTTAVGFASLMLAESRWVQEFGLASVIGVCLSFVAVMTVIPLATRSPLGKGIERGINRGLIDRRLDHIGSVVSHAIRYHRPVSIVAIIGTLVCAGLTATMRPDQRNSDSLPASSEPVRALQFIDRAFGGLELARVNIQWTPEKPDDEEIMQAIASVDRVLEEEPLIGHPLSIVRFINALPGEGPPQERMSLVKLMPPQLSSSFFLPDAGTAVVTFRVQDLGIATYGPVFQRVAERLQELSQQYPGFRFELTGPAIWRWENLYQLVIDLALSLCTAAAVILVILTVVFRSVRLGLISLVPNVFPIAITGTYLKLSGYNLEPVMVCSFTVCLGIAVDDTIHFVSRYLEELRMGAGIEQAIHRAFSNVGTALLMTTLVLVAGFIVVTWSDSHDHHVFALMGAITISSALFCDLVFLPALLKTFHSGLNRDR